MDQCPVLEQNEMSPQLNDIQQRPLIDALL